MRKPPFVARGLASAVAVLALGALVKAAPARADTLDPSLPHAVTVGPPRGAAPSERLDPRRTGRARTHLPAAPAELWRRHVSGNIEVPPVVDEGGNLLVATTVSELVKLAPDARELWRARFGNGNANAAAAPMLLAGGTVVVLTQAGWAWGFSPSGAPRFATPLGFSRRDVDSVPVALENGGFVVAAGNTVVELTAEGAVRARGTLDDRPPGAPPVMERAYGAVVDSPGGALVTTASGNVYRFHPPAAPRRIGSLGGVPVRGALLADDRTLAAIVDGRRLVELDLPTGTTHVRAAGLLFDAPPALGPGGEVLAVVHPGLLLGIDASGNERFHVLLDKAPPVPALPLPGPVVPSRGGLGVSVDVRPAPPVIVDPAGRVAFLRASGRVGVISPEGKVHVATERVCASPMALAPAGDKRMVVACRDGGLRMFGE